MECLYIWGNFALFLLVVRVLLDCSIRIAIQFGGLNFDRQSKVKIRFWIWIVNQVPPFQSKSKISEFHCGLCSNNEAKLLFSKTLNNLLISKVLVDKRCLFGIP